MQTSYSHDIILIINNQGLVISYCIHSCDLLCKRVTVTHPVHVV